jgi:hypothetical protein
MFSEGTKTLSIIIIPVQEALNENFPSILGAVNPSISFSRIKPLITPSSLAQTTKISAMGELVIQHLVPFNKYPPETFSAFVLKLPGSFN